ncbi:MAG: GNAT family N-acetyltransferase [Thermomicrobiales bacterium]|nr:GNAT family N-acetyltransferase [Thermomicrobiales bacterium]
MTPIFVSERLTVRRWTPDDLVAFHAIFSEPEMYRYMPGEPMASLEAASATMDRMLTRMAAWEGMGSFAVVDHALGEVVGNVLLRPLEEGPRVEVGYHIATRHWGRGYATEVARGAVRYGFEQLGLDEIFGVVVPDNIASRRVLEKAGLTRIGPGHVYGLDCDVMRIRRDDLVGGATST